MEEFYVQLNMQRMCFCGWFHCLTVDQRLELYEAY